jgi:hypothetical protein
MASDPESTERKQGDPTRFKPGQSGNPTGRPKGSRNKLSEDFLLDFCEVWAESGIAAIRTMATTEPAKFVQMAAGLLPKELKAEVSQRFVMRMFEVAETTEEWLETYRPN